MSNEKIEEIIDLTELVYRYFEPLKLRAIRLSRGENLNAIVARCPYAKSHILTIERGHLYGGLKDKETIYNAYQITEKDVTPTLTEVNRLVELLSNYSTLELQMALDLKDAETRTQRYLDNRRKHVIKFRQELKEVPNPSKRVRNVKM